ncbi:MAG: thioredoxin family protein [SAR202 cluster bacterium]|jgi:alkyl hydroperoxide reductase subunit AhpF|nr:thioredoxin family protein [SAR202 cluster bacterium]MDP6511778.1 thioredoxin family protein [SAR202 cluster bacterium]MDP6715244.1 thioredoxin family protein [SAR202 cluster bacterium]
MPILQPQDEEAVRQRFESELAGEVKMTLVTHNPIGGLMIPGRDCPSCPTAQQLIEEVVALSPKIELEIIDFYRDSETAKSLGVDKIPAVIVHNSNESGAKFYGLPSGFEFPVLLDAIVAASTQVSGLSESALAALAQVTEDVHIQVFVTPT